MKTKIMISAVAFFAVAIIGLARPSGASPPYEMGTIAQEPVTGAADSLSLETAPQESQPTQESQEEKQAKKVVQPKESQEKAKKETTLKIEPQESSEDSVEITIIEGDTKKVIQVEKPVTKVIKDEAGKKIVVLSGEKEVLVIDGGDVQLKIKGDKAVHLKTAEPFKLEKGLEIKSTAKYEPGEKTIIIEGKPHIEIVKEVNVPGRTTIYFKSKEGEVETLVIAPKVKGDQAFHLKPVPVEPHIAKEPHVAPEPPAAVEPPVAAAPRVSAEPRVEAKPHAVVEPEIIVKEPVHVHEFLTGSIAREQLQKKIAETQVLLRKIEDKEFEKAEIEAQKEALRELKESLKDLQQELEKEKEGFKKAVRVKVDKPEKSFSVVLAKPHVTVVGEVEALGKGKDNVITVIEKNGACMFVFTGKLREGQSETYEKAVEKLRKDLPQGYKLESELQEKSGTFVVKVKGDETTEESLDAVKALLKAFQEELKD